MAALTFKTVITGASNTIQEPSPLSYSGTYLSVGPEAIAGSATTQLMVTLDVSAVTGFAIVSTVDATLKTNDTGTPAHTLALRANEPYHWHTNSYDTFKLATTDITSMYFVVAGATAGTVSIEAVYDVTP